MGRPILLNSLRHCKYRQEQSTSQSESCLTSTADAAMCPVCRLLGVLTVPETGLRIVLKQCCHCSSLCNDVIMMNVI